MATVPIKQWKASKSMHEAIVVRGLIPGFQQSYDLCDVEEEPRDKEDDDFVIVGDHPTDLLAANAS